MIISITFWMRFFRWCCVSLGLRLCCRRGLRFGKNDDSFRLIVKDALQLVLLFLYRLLIDESLQGIKSVHVGKEKQKYLQDDHTNTCVTRIGLWICEACHVIVLCRERVSTDNVSGDNSDWSSNHYAELPIHKWECQVRNSHELNLSVELFQVDSCETSSLWQPPVDDQASRCDTSCNYEKGGIVRRRWLDLHGDHGKCLTDDKR